MAKEIKTTKTFRFSHKTIYLIEKIAEIEKRSRTNAIEKMVQEKAQFYKIQYLKPIERNTYNGEFDHLNKENPYR